MLELMCRIKPEKNAFKIPVDCRETMSSILWITSLHNEVLFHDSSADEMAKFKS